MWHNLKVKDCNWPINDMRKQTWKSPICVKDNQWYALIKERLLSGFHRGAANELGNKSFWPLFSSPLTSYLPMEEWSSTNTGSPTESGTGNNGWTSGCHLSGVTANPTRGSSMHLQCCNLKSCTLQCCTFQDWSCTLQYFDNHFKRWNLNASGSFTLSR